MFQEYLGSKEAITLKYKEDGVLFFRVVSEV